MKIPTEELPTIVKKNCEEQAKFIQKIVDRHNYDKRRFPSKISAWQYMAHQEIAYPGPHHPYVYHLLPELGEEAMKFKKNKNLPKYARPVFIRIISEVDTTGTFKLKKNEFLFHAGTVKQNGEIYAIGGRVLNYVCLSEDFKTAKENIINSLNNVFNIDDFSSKGLFSSRLMKTLSFYFNYADFVWTQHLLSYDDNERKNFIKELLNLNFSKIYIWIFIPLFLFLLFALIKAIVPRYRYDQLMRLGWKIFLPLSLTYVVLTASYLFYFNLLPTI